MRLLGVTANRSEDYVSGAHMSSILSASKTDNLCSDFTVLYDLSENIYIHWYIKMMCEKVIDGSLSEFASHIDSSC